MTEHARGSRSRALLVTEAGKQRFAEMDRESTDAIGAVLDGLGDSAAVVAAISQLQGMMEPEGTLTLRDPGPGDLGWIIERHGVLYGREYGYDQSMERLIARIMAEFDPDHDRAWIAEIDGIRVGAILYVRHDGTTGKLRTLLVEPTARGKGVGKALVDAVIQHAKARGDKTLTLYTHAHLHAARRIYETAGFTLTHSEPERAYGHDHVAQTWSLTLNP